MNVLPYLIYFLGPLVLAWWLGRRRLRAPWGLCAIGFVAFLLAWIINTVLTGTAGAITGGLHPGTMAFAVVVSVAAGVFEETARYVALRLWRRRRGAPADARGGMMYAIGHSGMESWIVGASLLLTAFVLANYPEILPEDIRRESETAMNVGLGQHLYGAVERLFVGLLIHACFTMLVVRSVARRDVRWLGLAILWHFAHDMVALNVHRLGGGAAVRFGWIGFIVVVYSIVLAVLWKTDRRGGGAAEG